MRCCILVVLFLVGWSVSVMAGPHHRGQDRVMWVFLGSALSMMVVPYYRGHENRGGYYWDHWRGFHYRHGGYGRRHRHVHPGRRHFHHRRR